MAITGKINLIISSSLPAFCGFQGLLYIISYGNGKVRLWNVNIKVWNLNADVRSANVKVWNVSEITYAMWMCGMWMKGVNVNENVWNVLYCGKYYILFNGLVATFFPSYNCSATVSVLYTICVLVMNYVSLILYLIHVVLLWWELK